MPTPSEDLDPAKRGPFVGQQSWRRLLFAHWPVAADALRAHVPPQLQLDLRQGQGWIGIVPFELKGLRLRHLPGLPGATHFLEMNLRTYVRSGDLPGIWFFSLDASSSLAVLGARTLLGLEYRDAEMSCETMDGWVQFRSRRSDGRAVFDARYRGTGFEEEARPGSLEEFLYERYRLFTVRDGAVSRLEIDHPPWKLKHADAEIRANTVAEAAGIVLPAQAPLVHYVERQDVRTGVPISAPSSAPTRG